MRNLIGRKIRLSLAAAVAGVAVLASTIGLGSAGSAEAALDQTGGYTVPNVDCTFQVTTGRLFILVDEPEMRSYYYGWQGVSWRPVLHRLNGTQWVRYLNGYEQKGTAGAYYQPDNFTNLSFDIANHGVYRVSIEYRWYTNGQVTGFKHVWAGTHFQWGQYYTTPARTVVVGISGQLTYVSPTGNEISIGGPLPSYIARDRCEF